MPEVILGIDPGSRTTGYALLTKENNKLIALRCDVIRLDKIDDHSLRLQKLFSEISNIIKSNNPDQCAVETPVYGRDPQAMLKLGRAQAACMLAITNSGKKAFEYYPKEVKKSITGNGNSAKEQVAFMLHRMVKLPQEKLPKDATDALAVAWCHMMRDQLGVHAVPKTSKKAHQNHAKDPWAAFLEKNPDKIIRK